MKTASLFTDITYKEDKPNINVLLETNFTKEIRIVFRKGQIMKEHKAPFSIVVAVAEGVIEFGVNNTVVTLKRGDLIALDPNGPHDLTATEDSVVRLTLAKGDSSQRVEQAVG
jgi:quercetin dioxygenase-like cupin family protein